MVDKCKVKNSVYCEVFCNVTQCIKYKVLPSKETYLKMKEVSVE